MRNPLRTTAVILALTLVGAGSGAIALPSRPPLDQAHRLVETALGTAAVAANAVTAVASAGLTQLAVSVGAYGLGGLAASPMLLVGFLVGVGASVLAMLMVARGRSDAATIGSPCSRHTARPSRQPAVP